MVKMQTGVRYVSDAALNDQVDGLSLKMVSNPRPGIRINSVNLWRFASCERTDGECSFVPRRSEEHTSELQSLMRTSYAVFCLKKKNINQHQYHDTHK